MHKKKSIAKGPCENLNKLRRAEPGRKVNQGKN